MAKFVSLPILNDDGCYMYPINIDAIAYIKPANDNKSTIIFSKEVRLIVNMSYEELSNELLSE